MKYVSQMVDIFRKKLKTPSVTKFIEKIQR